MNHVEVKPELLRWAREGAGHGLATLRKRFPQIEAWERGEAKPTLKQLEAFAKANFVPVGYLFLSKPPVEQIPIPDLRTIGSHEISHPSPDLLDVIYLCQRRQAWYRDFARSVGEERRGYVGSATFDSPVEQVATDMRGALGFDLDQRRECPTWTDALRRFIEQAEELGVLVMVSGVVGTNNRRKLDPKDFRGFALADDLAPLVFINGADTKAAQMFTLAHELAHLWLGESALSDVSPASTPTHRVERWCNAVAAELLVPLQSLRGVVPGEDPLSAVGSLARQFKVSTLVILRRILDAGYVSRDVFQAAYNRELELLRARESSQSGGGSFYLTQEVRASRRFVRALVTSTLEGQTLFRDAFELLGLKKEKTLLELGHRLGVAA